MTEKKVAARFWRSASGREPVREWLRDLPEQDRRTIGRDIATVEYGWPVGMPICRPMSGGLFEVRSSLSDNRIARVLFSTRPGVMVLLHAFIKKTQRAPADDLALARKRMKEIE